MTVSGGNILQIH